VWLVPHFTSRQLNLSQTLPDSGITFEALVFVITKLLMRHKSDNTITVKDARQWEGVDWIHLAQDRDQWRALLNMVMDLQVP